MNAQGLRPEAGGWWHAGPHRRTASAFASAFAFAFAFAFACRVCAR